MYSSMNTFWCLGENELTTHVFIVDSTTFKIHLEYLFAGTGAKNYTIDFNNTPHTSMHPTIENMLIGMIADASRIRQNDNIIFYLQQGVNNEGTFYGIFRAVQDLSFLDNNDSNQYLIESLGKSLTFRTLIEPYIVYSKGVTEWEALDEIRHIHSPNQMLWSLIYRKLKGNRGNTMITIYESQRLFQLIADKNNKQPLQIKNTQRLSFDSEAQEIIIIDKSRNTYKGRSEVINILPRLLEKANARHAFEAHLQAYMLTNIGRGTNPSLDNVVLENGKIEWLGNEVSCGVGMQRIDIMYSTQLDTQKLIVPIELKAVEAQEKNIKQITRYVDWIKQYYCPNLLSDIQPILLARWVNNRNTSVYKNLVSGMREFNQQYCYHCNILKYIEFKIEQNSLTFIRINYE